MTERLWTPPPSWTWASFGDVARVHLELVDAKRFPDAIHIAPNHIESGSARLLATGTVAGDKVAGPKHRFCSGDILYSKIRPYLAKAAMAPCDGFCSSDMYPVRTRLVPAFLLHWLVSPAFTHRVARDQGRTVLPKVNLATLNTLPVPVAPYNEQRRIVAKLESLQARSRRARDALDAVPPLLEKLRQSILAAAFRGDLTKDWRAKHPNPEPATELLDRIRTERRKKWIEAELLKLESRSKAPADDRWHAKYKQPDHDDANDLPDLPHGWSWMSVEELGLIESGQTTDGLAEHVSSNHPDVPWFRVSDMNRAENTLLMKTAEIWLSTADIRRFGLHVRPEGTIIFPKRGGAIATNKKRRLAQPSTYDLNTMGIIPVDSYADYVWTWFQRVDLGQLNTGTSVPQINHGDIAPLRVPVPPVGEAQQIAVCVTAMFAQLEATRERLQATVMQCDQLDKGILAKAFRGELVPQDPSDEPAEALLARLRGNETSPTLAKSKPRGRRSKAAE